MLKKCLLAGIIGLYADTVQAQLPVYRHYTVSEGLAHSTVYYIMQDSKGYMWFCTEAGVNRFDGHHFETFTINNGLADNVNFKCFEDSRGRVWFLSYNGRLSYFHDTGFINETTDRGLAYNSEHGKYLADLAEDNRGNIWFTVFPGGLYKYDGKKVTCPETGKGNLYLLFPGPAGMKTLEYLNGKYQLYNVSSRRTDSCLHLNMNGDRGIWSATRKQEPEPGIWYFITTKGLEHIKDHILFTDVSNERLNDWIKCFRISENDLWLGTEKGACYIPDFLTKGFTGRYKKFLDGPVSSIVNDSEGGIWLNTLFEGVYYIPASRSYITNIPAKALTSIKYNEETGLWAAANNYGEIMLYDKKGLLRKYRYLPYPPVRIKELRWLSNNKLLAISEHNPYVYDISSNSSSPLFPPLSFSMGKDVDINEKGIWVCGREAIYLTDSTGSRCLYNGTPNHVRDKLVSIAANGEAGCWFTSISTLYRLALVTLKINKVADQEVFHSSLSDLAYVNGYLWAATRGNGIFIFKEEKLLYHFNTANSNLTNDICEKLVYDGKNRVWIATNKGVSVFDVYSFKHLFRFSLNDVLISNDVKDIDISGDKAYVATPSGVSVIDISKFISATDPPKVYIKNLVAGKKLYRYPVAPAFQYLQGNITLSYTAITFQAGQSVRYRYRITNKDKAWNETEADQVQFYSLAPGAYTFSVSAKKYNSTWSKPVSYSFTVLPLWYQTTWFKFGVGLLAAAIIYIAYRRQVKRIRKREYERTANNKRIAELEGNALANQMNPHFIFNSLNTVQQFMLKKDEKTGLGYLNDFSTLIRDILKYSRKPYIDIEDEIHFLKRYLELEQIRFNNKFTFSFQIDEEVLEQEITIPPMLIQPLLENAVKYGVTTGDGHITMNMRIANNMLIVEVDDNGQGIHAAKKSPLRTGNISASTALKVIESRLKLLHGPGGIQGSLTLLDKKEWSADKSGTKAIIQIPLETNLHYDKNHYYR